MADPSRIVGYLEEAREELRREVCYAILVVLGFIGLCLLIVAGILEWPARMNLPIILLMAAPFALWPLVKRRPGVAFPMVTLVYGLLILLLATWYPGGGAQALLVVPTITATLLLGPSWGLLLLALSTYLALGGGGLLPSTSFGIMVLAVVVIWSGQAIFWSTIHFVEQGMTWSWRNYQRNADLLEKARDQRVELKQVQADLLQANSELARLSNRLDALLQIAEDARRAKEEFVANVSHELRTPLNMILGFSETIMRAPQAYGQQVPHALLADVGVILRNSQHLSDLVSDVLELARVDASPTGLQCRWTRLGDIIQEADAAIRPLFEAKGLYLRTERADTDLRLYCDGLRIRQVLLNLLSNAARATEKGGVIVTAWVSDGRANVSVADTGPGISPEDQERIFEPFRQAGDSILRRNAGSGLGLTLSRRFVELHGGKLSLESQVGVGSVFSFTLPLQPVEALSAPALQRWFNPYTQYEARDRPSKARPLDLRSRYLVLESGDTLSRLLERHEAGIEVLHVDNQEKMLTEVARALPRVVIINHTPPTEIPSLLTTHDLPYGLPILGCWVPSVREAAEQLGVQDYLVKPVNREDLFAALDGIGDVRSTLLIDDNIDAVQLFTRMLKSSRPHLRILSTTSCKRALDLLRIQRPDVILLDLVMPGMTGYDFLSIKSQQPNLRDIPVIAISAQDPAQTPLGNDMITISRTGGLSLRDLFTCVRQISEVLAPETAPSHPEFSTDPPV